MEGNKYMLAGIPSDPNRDLMYYHWKRISKRKVLKNNPNPALAKLMNDYKEAGMKVYWYSCDYLKGNICTNHENRPPICRGYPWYGEEPNPKTFLYGKNCGYKVDQLTGVKEDR
jgi:Fe-S-cluster containining protein